MSAITVSPQRRRLALYFDMCDHNIRADDFECFVAHLLRRVGRRIILVIDRWQVHRSAARRLIERFPSPVRVEWLPPYAPDLNPDEQLWRHTKYAELANYIPDDVKALGRAVRRSIRRTGRQQPLLRSFFEHAKLKL